MLKTFSEKFGPGFLFAAGAVGVSHLVQSTRSGAEFGFSLIWLMVLACLVKYPAFRFGSDYSGATGESLIDAYEKQGKWTLAAIALVLPIDAFIATSAITLVTAGLFKHIFSINLHIITVAFIILATAITLLISGKYQLLEKITKLFVVLFTLLTLVATVLALPQLDWQNSDLTPTLQFDRSSILFMIAIAGWMPAGVTSSIFQSLWVCAKAKSFKNQLSSKEVRFDFNVGYFSTMLLALCFVLLGTALLYNSGVTMKGSAAGFASQIIELFTNTIGGWAHPIIALAALTVMFSTVLAILDGCSRSYADIISRFFERPKDKDKNGSNTLYNYFMFVQAAGAILLLLFFLDSFKVFIDFATSFVFFTAPFIALFNHRAMRSAMIQGEDRLSTTMHLWSICGIAFFVTFALCYLYFRVF